ncbi:MAG: bifunctional indole-3-glycerol-phosphate synthase TrpC/phosphoribosylanthranilate isomerase TrpF, partial [Corynebacterium sp.]|nr:bifunctional indole-3-glycerol-phosphate synthase TrpC/phosphoribosylanthranilate isomerase TrpF [Corynebacterium sp.]
CKDFIIDPVQVRAARHYGADAILLMLSVLSDEEYTELAELAKSYNLDILTEVIDEEEMARAEKLGAKIIGINHRNLHDLTIDLSRSAKLAKLLPEGALLVSESGIRDHGTVVELAAHSDAFLVGSQLTGSPDVDEACRKLLFGDLKVCGLTQGTSAQAARALGATYGGLIFEEASPRFIDKDKAVEIMDAEPGLKYVAVIRNLDSMRNIPADPRIVAYQIHAELNEPPAIPEDKEFWLAINADNPPATIPEADRYVLDKGQGGSGQAFDWRTIEKLPLSDEQLSRTLLAGGLNEENIEGALRVVAKQKLAGVDLNSGVERAPGIKDAVKLRECSKKIRTFHI